MTFPRTTPHCLAESSAVATNVSEATRNDSHPVSPDVWEPSLLEEYAAIEKRVKKIDRELEGLRKASRNPGFVNDGELQSLSRERSALAKRRDVIAGHVAVIKRELTDAGATNSVLTSIRNMLVTINRRLDRQDLKIEEIKRAVCDP